MGEFVSDSIFTPSTSNAGILSRLNRVEGAIPFQRAGSQVYSASAVTAPTSSGVIPTSKGIGGQINPVSGINTVGNAYPYTVQGNFNFSATSSAITIFWDGTNGSNQFVIKRSDGTNFTIPPGRLQINGLSAGVVYRFAPYLNLNSPNNVSFVAGDSGTPRFAFSPNASSVLTSSAIRTQQLQENEAITPGFIQFTMPSSSGGTSSGSGSAPPPTPYCTVVGTPLMTPDGPIANDILMAEYRAGREVFLIGRNGPEKIISMIVRDVDESYRIYVDKDAFECSGTTTLMVENGKHVWCKNIPEGSLVDTTEGFARMGRDRIKNPNKVMQIELSGPSHEYRVGKVWTHNTKASSE